MKLAFQLAYKNLVGSGLKTWLNVLVLAIAFLTIIFFNGFIDGWHNQAKLDSEEWEIGGGHILNNNYDSSDPFTIQDGHGPILTNEANGLTPILFRQGTIYPSGRMYSALIKGIDVNQNTLKIPTNLLKESTADIPAIIGKRYAKSSKLKVGDEVLMRWRDKNGTFDASNITIVGIFDSNVPTIDVGQIWMPIKKLWEITGLENEATMFVANVGYTSTKMEGWNFQSKEDLLSSLTRIIESKKASGSIMYIFLMGIALLAIFDTQVLSIFRRQREIGTYISLGMTRLQVVKLFTVEGSMYSILATLLGTILGIPLFGYVARTGIGIPEASQNQGVTISDTIYPAFGIGLILSTIILIILSSTIVSFLPARKIAKMDPVNALKGKIQ